MTEQEREIKLIDKQIKKLGSYKRKFYSFTNGGDSFYSKLGLVAGGLLTLKSIFLPSFVPLYHTLEVVAGVGTLALVGLNYLIYKVRSKRADAEIGKIEGANELFELLGVRNRDIKLDLLGGYLTFKKAMIRNGQDASPMGYVNYLLFKEDYLKSIMIDTEHNKKKAKEFIEETMGPKYKKVIKEKAKEINKNDGNVIFRQYAYADTNKIDQMELAYYNDYLRLKQSVKDNYIDYLDKTGETWADGLTFSTRISLLNQQAIFNDKFENAGYEVTAKDFQDFVIYRSNCISDAISMFNENPRDYADRMDEKYGNSFWRVAEPIIAKISSDKRYQQDGELICDDYVMFDMDKATMYKDVNTYFRISEDIRIKEMLEENNITLQKEDEVKSYVVNEDLLNKDNNLTNEVNHEEPIVIKVDETQLPQFNYNPVEEEKKEEKIDDLTIDVTQRNALADYYFTNESAPQRTPQREKEPEEMGMSM